MSVYIYVKSGETYVEMGKCNPDDIAHLIPGIQDRDKIWFEQSPEVSKFQCKRKDYHYSDTLTDERIWLATHRETVIDIFGAYFS